MKALAGYDGKRVGEVEIPFMPGRVVLQDFTGVPAVVDLAAMRSGIVRMTGDESAAKRVNPIVPCDLVVDHSVQVDAFGSPDALRINSELEFQRNRERYELLKWAQGAFDNFRVVPPATGIVHQVNLEYLAKVVWDGADVAGQERALYPDSVVGTDSHTTMINGLGVLGWGVGGIEAEAVMLSQPIYMLIPEVVGVELVGRLPEGATATDMVLRVTELLRGHGVVGKFVEFHGAGLDDLPLANRATIANMAPEYGATIGLLPRRRPHAPVPRAERPRCEARRRRRAVLQAPGPLARAGAPRGLQRGPAPRPREHRALPRRAAPAPGPRRPHGDEGDLAPGPLHGVRQAVADPALHPRVRRQRRHAERGGGRERRPRSGGARRRAFRAAPRLRRDRRDHLVHQHLEPRGDARRRPAGAEGPRAGAASQALGEDVPRSGLEGGDRVLPPRRPPRRSRRARLRRRGLRLHHVHRELGAAAGADREGRRGRRPGGRRGALGKPQLRGPREPPRARQLPGLAAPLSSPTPWRGASTSISRASPSARARTASPCTCARSGRARRKWRS